MALPTPHRLHNEGIGLQWKLWTYTDRRASCRVGVEAYRLLADLGSKRPVWKYLQDLNLTNSIVEAFEELPLPPSPPQSLLLLSLLLLLLVLLYSLSK